MLQRLFPLCILTVAGLIAFISPAAADTYTVTLDPAARSEPATGRIILFFITKTSDSRQDRRWQFRQPIEAPFFDAPQPIASIEVKDLKPGDSVTITGATPAFPDSLDKLDGKVRVQAMLDADQTERSHEEGPGNVFSDVLSVEFSASKNDESISLKLNHKVEARSHKERAELKNLRWVTLRSELLSKFYGRDVYHRAGVALPKGYNDPKWPRQQWPAVYEIPGYGGREDAATEYMAMLATNAIEEIAPIAVYIVLDPESPLGHHGFVDSPCNGPRETALLTELIPYLEKEFRLVSKPEARLVAGHSSGAWSSLWLQLNHPDVFGGCWSSSPDPIDFTAFQMSDLYNDKSMFTDAQGKDSPSYRRVISSSGELAVLMTVRQEVGMEFAIDPHGRSGQQWDAWNAMFSPKDDATGSPQRMFDPKTGEIDKKVVEVWSKFDITKMVTAHWDKFGPGVLNKVHLVCGDEDDYFLNRAVDRFKAAVEKLKAAPPGSPATTQPDPSSFVGGYIEIIPKASHGSIEDKTGMRTSEEMRRHLQHFDLQDPGEFKPNVKK